MLFWNPAGVAGAGRHDHEIALHHSETVLGQGNAIAAYFPPATPVRSARRSTSSTSGRSRSRSDDQRNGRRRRCHLADVLHLRLTYAAPQIGPLSIGVTAKHCSCAHAVLGLLRFHRRHRRGRERRRRRHAAAHSHDSAHARRGRAQSRLRRRLRESRRIDMGADYRVVSTGQYGGHVEAHAIADVVTKPGLDSATASDRRRCQPRAEAPPRAGYIHDAANGSGASVGVGISSESSSSTSPARTADFPPTATSSRRISRSATSGRAPLRHQAQPRGYLE